jgi:hypothetical protein
VNLVRPRVVTGVLPRWRREMGDGDRLPQGFSRRRLARLASVVLLHEFFGAGGTIRGELRLLSRSANP